MPSKTVILRPQNWSRLKPYHWSTITAVKGLLNFCSISARGCLGICSNGARFCSIAARPGLLRVSSGSWEARHATFPARESFASCFSNPGHLRPVIIKPAGRIFEISDSNPKMRKMRKAPPTLQKQGFEEIPQSKSTENAENADAKTRKMRLIGVNVTGLNLGDPH